MTSANGDVWSRWLLERRFGGDRQLMETTLAHLYAVRDRILSRVTLGEGEVLADVGCGDGLIGFGALRDGKTSKVVFVDISRHLLGQVETGAQELNLRDRCKFVCASADDLSPLDDASVDAVTTRSVLIYVSDKARALREFYRVLAPGGRLSIFEPINRFAYPGDPTGFFGYDVSPVRELADRVKAVYLRRQPPDSDPMLNFDERDLLTWARDAGFREVHLEFCVDVVPLVGGMSWEIYSRIAPNPKAPTPEEAIGEALSPSEAERFTAHLRSAVEEADRGATTMAVAYLWASK